MRNIFEEALVLQQFLEEQKLEFCFIGGLALQRWGDLRTTNHIDLTLFTGFSGEESMIDLILSRYEGRLSDAKEVALETRVLLIRSESGIGIDMALGGMLFEEATVKRSSKAEFLPGVELRTCSAEDLIVHKVFASRQKDWLDVEGIILRQRVLDWDYIEGQLVPLLELKEEPEHLQTLESMRKRLLGRDTE